MYDNINSNNLSQVDLYNLSLLDIQETAAIEFIISDIFSYISTIQGKQIILNSLDEVEKHEFSVRSDVTALIGIYFWIVGRLNFAQVAISRYNFVYNEYLQGEMDYSLGPNIDFVLSNMLSLIAILFSFKGAVGIYERDNNQPVFGV